MKFRILFHAICILLFLVLQSTVLQYARIYNVIPNLLIVYVIIAALIRGNVEGGIIGFFAGLALDMTFGKLLGFYALLGMYLGIAVGSVNRRLYRENLLVVVFFTFAASVIYETAVYFLNTVMSGDMNLIYPMTGRILPEALYNSVAAIFIYWLVMRMNRRFEEASKAARKY